MALRQPSKVQWHSLPHRHSGVNAGSPGGAVTLAALPVLVPGAGGTVSGAVSLSVGKTLTIAASLGQSGAAALSVGKTLTVGAFLNMVGAVTMQVLKSLGSDATVSTTTVTQLGKTTDGTGESSSTANKTIVSKFTATTSGNVTAGHARMRVDSGTASVQMVVYADSAGAPGALLALSTAVTLSNATEALIDFVFPTGQQAAIASGTDYWIGHTWADPGTNSVFWSRDATAGQAQQNSLQAANPFGTPGTTLSGPIDAYIDVTTTTSGGGGGGTVLPVVRGVSSASGASAGSTAVVNNTISGLAVGDLLIGIGVCDNDGTLTALTGPSWGSPSFQAPAAGGQPGMKVWAKVATSTDVAAANWSFSAGTGVYCSAGVVAIQAGTFNAADPYFADVVFNISTSLTTSHVAPTIGTGIDKGLLVTVHSTDQGGAASCSYTPPTGMTERVDTAASSGFTCLEINTLALTSSAATGTKTATCTASRPSTCASFIISPA
jgi:hypothetical protein